MGLEQGNFVSYLVRLFRTYLIILLCSMGPCRSKFKYCLLPLSHLKHVVKSKSNLSWLNRWSTSDNGRITYSFIPGSIPKHLLSKSFSHKITQVLTGHCKLNFFLNSIGKTLDPTCSCRKGIETVNHYLWNCENEEINRSVTIKKACFTQGIPYPPDNNLLVENPVLFQALCRFLSNSSRLNL